MSGTGKRPRDGGFDSGIPGFDGFREDIGDVAVAADQVFMKVPARYILRPSLGGPLIERVRVGALHGRLGSDGKGDAMVLGVLLISLAPPGSWPPKSLDGTPSIISPRP